MFFATRFFPPRYFPGRYFPGGSAAPSGPTSVLVRGAQDGPMMMIQFTPDSGDTGPGTFQGIFRPNTSHAWSGLVTLLDQDGANLESDGYSWGFDHCAASHDPWSLSFVKSGVPVTYFCADVVGLTWTLES